MAWLGHLFQFVHHAQVAVRGDKGKQMRWRLQKQHLSRKEEVRLF